MSLTVLHASIAIGQLALLLLITPALLSAQTLNLSSAAATPGERVVIEISLSSPEGRAPQALQWETSIPSAQLSFVDEHLRAGPAAEAVNKSFSCAPKAGADDRKTLLCILAGGLATIPNGVVGLLRLQILPQARPGPAAVHSRSGIAVLEGPQGVPLGTGEAVVTIRPASKPAK